MRIPALAVVAGAALLVVVAPASSRGDGLAGAAIFCGSETVGGATVLQARGSARATVKLGGKTLKFSGGRCEVKAGHLSLVVGRFTVPRAKTAFRHACGPRLRRVLVPITPGRGTLHVQLRARAGGRSSTLRLKIAR